MTIQYPEKGIRVLTQSLPFPDGKLSPEEDKDSSKVIQQVRGRDRIQLKSCLLGLFLSSRVFPPGQEEKTKHATLHFRGKWRQAGKGVTGHIQRSSFPWAVDIAFLEEAQQIILCHQCEFNPFRFHPFRQVKQTHQLLQITCRIIRTVNSPNRLTQKGHLFQITRSFGLKEAWGVEAARLINLS